MEEQITPSHINAGGNKGSQPGWVFGYGSLIWRTGFPFAEVRPAYVKGYARRFWQGSIDHRGVPGKPGRVVTLDKQVDSNCWGHAYRLDPQHRDAVLEQLDEREVGGYERHYLAIDLDTGPPVDGLTWVAWPDNRNYLGPSSPRQIAEQVVSASGPSGDNDEYVLRLAESLRAAGEDDPHVMDIAAWVRQLTSG